LNDVGIIAFMSIVDLHTLIFYYNPDFELGMCPFKNTGGS